jgi:hypothetical protein
VDPAGIIVDADQALRQHFGAHLFWACAAKQVDKPLYRQMMGGDPSSGSTAAGAVASQKMLALLHRQLLPPFIIMVVLCYIDRTNLAFASLSLNRDLGFTPAVYGLGSGLFFLGYSLFMIPSNLILLKVRLVTAIR